ncbi:MAG: hypothetical protein ACW97O_06385 [Candidatus Thorarchaeota archaeon]
MRDNTDRPVENLGYHFYHRINDPTIGYSRIGVTIRTHPTEEHFDPEEFRLRVASQERGIEYLYVTHPWSGEEHYRACVGHVAIKDRKEKFINAYTFGGDLRIKADSEKTTCDLISPVPCFRIEGVNTISKLLAQETDILLAKIAAETGYNEIVFEQKISSIDPVLIYGACLVSIQSYYENFDHDEIDYILDLIQFIKHEKERLQMARALPFPIPELIELL